VKFSKRAGELSDRLCNQSLWRFDIGKSVVPKWEPMRPAPALAASPQMPHSPTMTAS